MGLGDVAGVFSRYFVVGFFLPSFFALLVLSQTVSDSFLPAVYLDARQGAQVLIVGGTALLLGLVLLGVHYPVLRAYEGYPLSTRGRRFYARPVYTVAMRWQKHRFSRLHNATVDPQLDPRTQRNAIWRLDQTFPRDAALLPTAFGNAVKAFERHSVIRWGLNAIAVWPHLELLMSAEERDNLADAKSDVAFMVNTSLTAGIAGAVLIANQVTHTPLSGGSLLLYLIPFVVAAAAYHAAIGAAVRWGSSVRAVVDIHRLELYDKLGTRRPVSFRDEREIVAPAVNAALLRGDGLPDALWAAPAALAQNEQDKTFVGRFREFLEKTTA
jgi:hypothetical protein